jgi:biotin-dependent carboxylase-like uncharacterized protein
MIKIIKPGSLTTVQDQGRFGFAHLGLSPAGAADPISFRLANLAVGNRANAAALEMTVVGATLEFEQPATIALSGASSINAVPLNQPIKVAAGSKIAVGPLTGGARAYLAVRGGFAVPKIMNSRSTYVQAGIGGFQGRALRAGDKLEISSDIDRMPGDVRPIAAALLKSRNQPIRVTRSVQSDWFHRSATELFYSQQFTVSAHSNRSGTRLKGQPVFPCHREELLTEGVPLGAVQIPPDGQPIILSVDHQTTGGYPKLATVITADLWRVAQAVPGESVRFQLTEVATVIELLRAQENLLRNAFASW